MHSKAVADLDYDPSYWTTAVPGLAGANAAQSEAEVEGQDPFLAPVAEKLYGTMAAEGLVLTAQSAQPGQQASVGTLTKQILDAARPGLTDADNSAAGSEAVEMANPSRFQDSALSDYFYQGGQFDPSLPYDINGSPSLPLALLQDGNGYSNGAGSSVYGTAHDPYAGNNVSISGKTISNPQQMFDDVVSENGPQVQSGGAGINPAVNGVAADNWAVYDTWAHYVVAPPAAHPPPQPRQPQPRNSPASR